MSNITQTPDKVIVDLDGAATPLIFNLSAPTANTEVSQVLSVTVKRLMIRARSGNAKIQFSFVTGESGTKFITIPAGCTYEATDLDLISATLFIQTDKSSQTIEILEWS